MMTKTVEIVDRDRGMQLSSHRVTLQDLVPYFQEGCSAEEILRWIPTLTAEEIAVVYRHYLDHRQELDEEDRLIRIRARSAERKNPAWVETVLEDAHAERLSITERLGRQSGNGDAR